MNIGIKITKVQQAVIIQFAVFYIKAARIYFFNRILVGKMYLFNKMYFEIQKPLTDTKKVI